MISASTNTYARVAGLLYLVIIATGITCVIHRDRFNLATSKL